MVCVCLILKIYFLFMCMCVDAFRSWTKCPIPGGRSYWWLWTSSCVWWAPNSGPEEEAISAAPHLLTSWFYFKTYYKNTISKKHKLKLTHFLPWLPLKQFIVLSHSCASFTCFFFFFPSLLGYIPRSRTVGSSGKTMSSIFEAACNLWGFYLFYSLSALAVSSLLLSAPCVT